MQIAKTESNSGRSPTKQAKGGTGKKIGNTKFSSLAEKRNQAKLSKKSAAAKSTPKMTID